RMRYPPLEASAGAQADHRDLTAAHDVRAFVLSYGGPGHIPPAQARTQQLSPPGVQEPPGWMQSGHCRKEHTSPAGQSPSLAHCGPKHQSGPSPQTFVTHVSVAAHGPASQLGGGWEATHAHEPPLAEQSKQAHPPETLSKTHAAPLGHGPPHALV